MIYVPQKITFREGDKMFLGDVLCRIVSIRDNVCEVERVNIGTVGYIENKPVLERELTEKTLSIDELKNFVGVNLGVIHGDT